MTNNLFINHNVQRISAFKSIIYLDRYASSTCTRAFPVVTIKNQCGTTIARNSKIRFINFCATREFPNKINNLRRTQLLN